MKITVDKNTLRAMSRFAPKHDIRYYLVGVMLELGADDARLVATNGHILAVMRLAYADGDERPAQTTQAIIPLDLVKSIKKPGRRDLPAVIVELDSANKITIYDGEKRSSAAAIDGKYPDYSRAFPLKVSGDPAQFNPDYLATFLRAKEDMGSDVPSIAISHNGNSAALVSLDRDDFIGLIMPIRANPVDVAPAWLRPTKALKAA